MRALSVRLGLIALALVLSVAFALPLASLFRHPDVSIWMKVLVAGVAVLAAVRPAAGVVALAVLLPLALAVQAHLGPLPGASAIGEALVFAFVAAAAPRLLLPGAPAPFRLGPPALVLGCLIAASLAVDLVSVQASTPARDVAASLWRHVVDRFLFAVNPFSQVHQAVRWAAGLALCVLVERAIRRTPAAGPMIARMFLAAGAASASFAALRLATILIEGKIAPSALDSLREVLEGVRITALHADPNAAGSDFLLFLVPALIVGVRRRSLALLLVVAPLAGLAFLLAQSRAAMLAVGIVLGILAILPLVRARRFALVAAVVGLAAIAGIAAQVLTRPSHASIGRAAVIRQEMAAVAFDMTADHPAFGVGIGRYSATSRHYISTDEYSVLGRWAPEGQNAHNNFLQILAELGIPALAAFLWLVLPVVRRAGWPAADAQETEIYGSALAAGIAAFLVSALFGHPLIVSHVASTFFLGLGITAGAIPAAAGAGRPGNVVAIASIAALALLLPWRIAEARRTPGAMDGVTAIAGRLDDVRYRVAEGVPRLYLPSDSEAATVWLRWESARDGCAVAFVFDGREVHRAEPTAEAWLPVRVMVPPGPRGGRSRALEMHVSAPECRLLIGPADVDD